MKFIPIATTLAAATLFPAHALAQEGPINAWNLQLWFDIVQTPLQNFALACDFVGLALAPFIVTIAVSLKMAPITLGGPGKSIRDALYELFLPIAFTVALFAPVAGGAFGNQSAALSLTGSLWDWPFYAIMTNCQAVTNTNDALQLALEMTVKGEAQSTVDAVLATTNPDAKTAEKTVANSILTTTNLILCFMYPTLIGLILSAIVTMAFLQALAPIFVALFPWEYTRKWFDRWLGLYLGTCIGAVATVVLVGAFLGNPSFTTQLKETFATGNIQGAAELSFSTAITAVILALGLLFTIPRVVSITSSIFK